MRRREGRLAVMFLVFSLLVTGCGGAEGGGTTTSSRQGKQQEEEPKYIEQAVVLEDRKEDGVSYKGMSFTTSTEGKAYQVLQSEDGVPYLAEQEGEGWKICPCPWEKDWKKQFANDKFLTGSGYVLDDKTWYVQVFEQTMAPDKERYEKDPEKYDQDYYTVHQYLMRIDRESGGVEEIPIPQTTMKQIYQSLGRKLPEGMNEKEVNWSEIKFFPDGNFFLYDMTHEGIYHGVTGEQITKMKLKNTDMMYTATGNGFFASIGKDQSTGKYILHVINEGTGEEEYMVELDLEERENQYGVQAVNVALGALEDTIVMAYDRCVYTMEYGDDEFHKVMDSAEGTMFYLPDEEYEYDMVAMGEKEDFYMAMRKESDTDRICHYAKG